MSGPVIMLDAAKLAKSGLLTPNTFNTGKLSWDIRSETGNQTFVIRYAVDTSRSDAMTMKLEYLVQLHGTESVEINYKVPLRRGMSAGEDAWGFVCPSTKKIVSRLILHPGDRYFIGDLRSVVSLQ